MADEHADLDAALAEALFDAGDEQDEKAVEGAASTNVPAVDSKADKKHRGGRTRVKRSEWSPLPPELVGFPFTPDVEGEFVICQALFFVRAVSA